MTEEGSSLIIFLGNNFNEYLRRKINTAKSVKVIIFVDRNAILMSVLQHAIYKEALYVKKFLLLFWLLPLLEDLKSHSVLPKQLLALFIWLAFFAFFDPPKLPQIMANKTVTPHVI